MNIFYDPAKFGLETVGTVDYSSGSYEFEYLAVWKDASGQLYYAEDSGCSCPSPFEGMGVTDLTKATRHEIAARAQERLTEPDWRDAYEHSKNEVANLIERLMAPVAP